MITGIAHINLVVPDDTLDAANAFYGTTLGLSPRAVPQLQRGRLAWFDIATSGQQVHVAFGKKETTGPPAPLSSRHPCFRLEGPEALLDLQRRVWRHFKDGGNGAPMECDEPGGENSGSKGVEYPQRFFARDYAGNRLEFSL